MDAASPGRGRANGPKRQKHYSYNENVDEPAKLIEDETVEIEREVPAEDKEPVESSEDDEKPASPAFDE